MSQYLSFRSAKDAAIKHSTENFNVRYYVVWIEGKSWSVDIEPEFSGDAYAFNGKWKEL